MKNYKVELDIPAESMEEVHAKADALAVMGIKFDVKMLKKLKYILIHEPEKIEMAKKFLGI